MRQRTEIWLVVLILIFLGVIFSLPLIFNFNSAIPYSFYPPPGFEMCDMKQGDHLQIFYTLSQVSDYFRERNSAFFEEPYEFTISGSKRYYSPRELPLSVLFAILSPLGNIAAYNIIVILSFAACGLSVFLLSGRYIKSFPARLVSGIIFAIFPFRLAQLYGGHPNGFMLFFLPLMLYGYESWMETGKWKYAILSGICIMSMALEEFHLVYYSALFTVVFLLYKAISVFIGKRYEWKGAFRKFVYLTLVIVIFWILAVGYIMHVKQIVFEPSIASAGREIGEIRLFAPEGSDFFRRVNRNSEKFIYPGIISIFLVLFAFRKRKRGQATFSTTDGKFLPQKVACPLFSIKWFYLAVFLITAILSLGPNLRFFPLYDFFYKFVPFFGYPRSTARIIVFAFLSVSILSGFGVENILKWKRGKMIAVIALIFLILDFHPLGRIGLCKLNKGNEVYEYIKEQDEKGVLLEIPLWPGNSSWSTIYEYYATIYHIPLINGYSSFVTRDYIENVFWPLVSINMGCLNREQYEKLQKLDVRYIILHEEAYPQKVSPFPFDTALRNMKHCPFARFVMEDGPLYLFELKSDFQGDYETQYSLPSKMGVFYECEYLPSRVGGVSLDVDASNGKARYGCESKSDEICLVFGPYQLFPPGKYKLIFRMKGKGVSFKDEFARIEVTASKGKEIISQRVINGADIIQRTGSYGDYELSFEISRLKELEFRVAWLGKGEIWADYIYLLFQEEKDPVLSYEARDMFHRAFAHGKADTHPPHRLVYGGTRRYARGSYTASFRLKAAERVEKTVATIRVLLSGSGVVLAEKKISGTDFDEAEKYQEIELPFTLKKMEVLDFEVFFEKVADIWVDKIEMAPVVVELARQKQSKLCHYNNYKSGLLKFVYKGVDFSGIPEMSVVRQPQVYYSRKKKHEQFSVIWLGYLKIDREGEYRIGTLSDDSSLVYVDEKQIVDNGRMHGARFVEGKVYLSRGFHRLMIKYSANGEDELFRLYWMEPGKWPVTVPIKSNYLFYLPGDTP